MVIVIRKSFVSFVVMAMTFAVLIAPATAQSADARSGERTIVLFADGVSMADGVEAVSGVGPVVQELPLVNGVVLRVPPQAAGRMLAHNPVVDVVEADGVVTVTAKPDRPGKPDKPGGGKDSKSEAPWGVDRIDADLVWGTTTGEAVRVAIVDTGIDATHPDLDANVVGGYSAVDYTASWADDDGHGTHVAGTVAAESDGNGVVGAAPDADLLGVKVLDYNGSGTVADVIEGIEWCVGNGVDVINMSLSTGTYYQSLDEAIQAAHAAGIVVVAAAGNSGPGEGTVRYPAKFANVLAVSATDSDDSLASFSSRGPEVDLAAPGVGIESTYWHRRRGSIYRDLDGTSMAAPHVSGVAALVLSTPVGAWDADGDGAWDPSEVATKLTATGEDLGPADFDSWYGHGLVDAEAAVAP